MIISYETFLQKLSKKIKTGDDFYYNLVKTIISNPDRYTGIFRCTSANTKIIQNVTQSNEIKFGDFMEDLLTDYIAEMGYINLDKNIGFDDLGNRLSADQVFTKDNDLFLIEQKIRDDHDSTKKRGQYQNFYKKYTLLSTLYDEYNIISIMWFIDETLTKNKKYYLEMAKTYSYKNVQIYILYGKELFTNVFNRSDVWDEICSHLTKYKCEHINETIDIPNFDTSPEILSALKQLSVDKPILIKKLMSNEPQYEQLRKELFPTMFNLSKL